MMRLELLLLGLILAILGLAMVIHKTCLDRIYHRVRKTTDGNFEMEELKKHLELPQGSNFNTMMLLSWLLFFVGMAYLFFQTPAIFQNWNYFQLPRIASAWYGMIIFGWGVMGLTFIPAVVIPEIYKYYIIHGTIKKMMTFLAPLLLTISILLSLYLGAIYPRTDDMIWYCGYFALLAPLILLLSPVFLSIKGGVR
ncbi:MAG TPA: hypothetical protein PLQ49_08200 [Methanothrix sp.]|nr:hypothetical protein [Methanothrix sp.]